MPTLTAVILAAGQGTRMRSQLPKMLHPLCGRPLVGWPIAAALEAGADRVVVVDSNTNTLEGRLPAGDAITRVVQPEPNGTGGAVQAAAAHIDPEGTVVVLPGDVPLITGAAVAALVATHNASKRRRHDGHDDAREPVRLRPCRARRRRPHRARRRDEDGRRRDEGAAQDPRGQQLDLRLRRRRPARGARHPQLPTTRRASCTCPTSCRRCARRATPSGRYALQDRSHALGVNDRVQLGEVRNIAQKRIHDAHRRAGVNIVDAGSTLIDIEVQIGEDTIIEPSSFLSGTTDDRPRLHGRAADDAHRRHAARRGHDPALLRRRRRDRVQGDRRPVRLPAPRHRPQGALEGRHVRRDQELRRRPRQQGPAPLLHRRRRHRRGHVNLGAATITANYDGVDKHRTTIGDRVHTSVDTTLVAPVTLGDDAYTAANSAITKNVPPGALGVARERQTNIEGYADRKRRDKP